MALGSIVVTVWAHVVFVHLDLPPTLEDESNVSNPISPPMIVTAVAILTFVVATLGTSVGLVVAIADQVLGRFGVRTWLRSVGVVAVIVALGVVLHHVVANDRMCLL